MRIPRYVFTIVIKNPPVTSLNATFPREEKVARMKRLLLPSMLSNLITNLEEEQFRFGLSRVGSQDTSSRCSKGKWSFLLEER